MNKPIISGKVLLISDDFETGQLWTYGLGQRGLGVIVVSAANEALETWNEGTFDLAIIDTYTPHLDELGLCERLRAIAINPILLFTAHQDETYVLAAYRAGVDECVVKPITPRLFMAKVMAWLHRSWTVPAEALDNLQGGDLRLDPPRRQLLMADGSVVKLTNLEFRLLHLLMSHQGQVLTTELIVDRIWGYGGSGDSALLKNVVYRLRRKIETDPGRPRYLQTVAGEGYAFQTRGT